MRAHQHQQHQTATRTTTTTTTEASETECLNEYEEPQLPRMWLLVDSEQAGRRERGGDNGV